MYFLTQLKISKATLGFLALLYNVILIATANAVEVDTVRLSQKQDKTRIVFDISGNIEHKVFQLDNPRRLVIDLANVSQKPSLKHLKLKGTPISKMRAAYRDGKNIRVVLDLKSAVTHKDFTLKANDKFGNRLVVDVFSKNTSSGRSVEEFVEQSDRKIVIAIDAGHGGVDPGALGPNRMREKIVVLQISKRLKSE